MSNLNERIYFKNLNGLRFFAALSVIIYHFYGLSVLNGHYGVTLFFVLSGFLITFLLLEEKDNHKTIYIKKFYIRRILRIWPLYFIIVVISSTIFFIQNPNIYAKEFFERISYYIFFIPNIAFVFNIGIKYASILWSVGSEEQYYLFWPWLIKMGNKRKTMFTFIIIILFFGFGPDIIDYINNTYFQNSNKVLFYFSKILIRMGFNCMATGALLAFVFKYYPQYLKILFSKTAQLIITLLIMYCWIKNVRMLFVDQFYATLFGLLILNLAVNPNAIFSLENKVFNYLGKISFGLYVYHLIAFDLNVKIIQLLGIEIRFQFLLFILGLFTTVLLSSISFFIIEAPFLKLKRLKFSIIKSGNE